MAGFIYNSDLDKKIVTLVTKAELKAEPDKIVKLQALHSCYFGGKSQFEDDGMQNYLVFHSVYKYLKKIANSNHYHYYENIKPHAASNNSLVPTLIHVNTKLRVKFDCHC